ncbi:MAG: hypothetical protein ABW157_02750 [Candidatus Thiodiazotropha sp. LLP2]
MDRTILLVIGHLLVANLSHGLVDRPPALLNKPMTISLLVE